MPEDWPYLSRQVRSAKQMRLTLIERLGSKCERCGNDNVDVLEFDHRYGRDWEPRKTSYYSRMVRYRREIEQGGGLIRLLCGKCNLAERKTNDNGRHVKTSAVVELTDNIPF